MDDKAEYYFKGYLLRRFKAGANLERLNRLFTDLADNGPRAPYSLKEKYAFSADLRPDVYKYDPVILDILFENGIHELVRNVTGVELHLAHIQLRISFPGESYMDWHRDTHFYAGKIEGKAPPVHKVIFYPLADGASQLQLKVSPGSHLRMLGNRRLDVLQARLFKDEKIHSSESQFLLFNTSILHAVAAEKSKRGSFRIIYAFCREDQLAEFADQKDLHREYRERLPAY
jgi:hypothetical protein